jgi:DNA (cytosine-5)-methyltransferase 1
MIEKPVAVDLFSGAGGLSEGLQMAGFDIRLGVESGLDPCLTYMENHPKTPVICRSIEEIPNFRFIVNRVLSDGKKIDLVAGGPPCQGFSGANTRTRGVDNGHSKLVWQFHRAVKQIMPRAFLMENVPGIKSIDEGSLVSDLTSSFERLGYDVVEMQLLASHFGVPQNRKRFFLLGSLEGKIESPKPTHGENGKKPLTTVKDAIIGDLPILGTSTGSNKGCYTNGPTSEYQRWARKNSPDLLDNVTTEIGEDVRERFSLIEQGGNLRKLIDNGELPEHLKIRIDHGGVYRRLCLDQPSYTIVNFRKAMIIHPLENRLLTLREAARLQSFRDNYRFKGKISFMQQVLGDSVPPLLAGCVAKQISKRLVD